MRHWPVVGVVLPAKRHALAIKRDQTVVADGDAMGIHARGIEAPQPDHRRPASHRPPNRSDTARRRRRASGRGRGGGPLPPARSSSPQAYARRSPSTNLPRKTRLSTFTGNKKPADFGRIHRRRSGEKKKPPAGTTQWTCGCRTSVWPHVWRMLEEPDVGAEVSGIGGDLEQGRRAGAKEQVIEGRGAALR